MADADEPILMAQYLARGGLWPHLAARNSQAHQQFLTRTASSPTKGPTQASVPSVGGAKKASSRKCFSMEMPLLRGPAEADEGPDPPETEAADPCDVTEGEKVPASAVEPNTVTDSPRVRAAVSGYSASSCRRPVRATGIPRVNSMEPRRRVVSFHVAPASSSRIPLVRQASSEAGEESPVESRKGQKSALSLLLNAPA